MNFKITLKYNMFNVEDIFSNNKTFYLFIIF